MEIALPLSAWLLAKRSHIQRLANQNGSAGEAALLEPRSQFLPRPKGPAMAILLTALKESGIVIKRTSFDVIVLPEGLFVDFHDVDAVRAALPRMRFIEVKTANQKRVRHDFSGFFFALTEGEIQAAEALGEQHGVVLLNKTTGSLLLTSVPEILARARSTNWQLSVQL